MATPCRRAPLIVLLCGLAVSSSPVQQDTSPLLVNTRFPQSQNYASNISIVPADTFDHRFAVWEMQRVLVKFAHAAKFLSDIRLQPDSHPEAGYPAFDSSSSNASAGILVHTEASNDDQAPDVIDIPPYSPRTAQMALKDFISGRLDVMYYGPMAFGSPNQLLNIDIDTGSADLWVPANCRRCENAQFVSKRSSTFKSLGKECTVTYAAGKVSGTLVEDVVTIGHASVAHQAFCAVNKESDELNDLPNSGLFGMAFGTIAQLGKPTFFENLLAEKKLAESIFSVHLTRKRETGSQVCFGCVDPTKMRSPIRWNPIVSRSYWSIAMSGISVNAPIMGSMHTDLIVAVDTGTSLIYLPEEVADAFYAMIPGSAAAVDYGPGFYSVPCGIPVAVSFNFSGQLYAVQPSDFDLGRKEEGSESCIGGIIAMGKGFPDNLVILGAEFLKSWYSVFDYTGRVGFAQSINNN